MARSSPHFAGAGLVRIGRARAFVRYLRDPAASAFGKVFLALVAAYVIWPADLVPDVPFIGWLDDLGAVTLGLAWVSRVLDRYRKVETSVASTSTPDVEVVERRGPRA